MKFVGMLSLFSFFWWGGCAFSPEFQALDASKFEHHFKTRKVYSVLVDARSADAFAEGHLKNAINIPFSGSFLENLEAKLEARNAPKSLLLFVYRESEASTVEMVKQLEQAAKDRTKIKHKIQLVHYLQGGYSN